MLQFYVNIVYKLGRTMHIVEGEIPRWLIAAIKQDYEDVPDFLHDFYLKKMAKKARSQRGMQQRYLVSQNAKRSLYEVDKHMEALLAHSLLSGNPHPIFNMI